MIAAGLIIAALVLIFHGQEERGPPCKPGDCDSCLMAPCSEAEKQKNTGA